MGSSGTADRDTPAGGPVPAFDPFLEAKLHKPPLSDDWVRRGRLLERMAEARHHPVSLVAAPACYGKTILVAQWLEEARSPRAAWVSLDVGDNDPIRMWTHVAAALSRAVGGVFTGDPPGRIDDAVGAAGSMLGMIVSGLQAVEEDIVLVLDDFHFITDAQCHEQVEHLLQVLPPQAHVVIISRSDPGLRLGRLRASGQLVEVRAGDLGFTPVEASSLLEHQHVALTADSLELLVQRTEGWPAGLYLATLSLGGRSDPDGFVRDFSGSNRFIGDYLTEEVLSRQTEATREFIITTSVLDRFCAPLCDHVTGHAGSASSLRDLQRTNLFLVPLDDEGRWFRFHHLFATVARTELEVTYPGRRQRLHARAAEWFEAHGLVDEAVRHSISAGDRERAINLVQANWLPFVDAGRIATVLGWLESIDAANGSAEPGASVTGAWLAALVGDEATLVSRMSALSAAEDVGPLADGSRSVESAIAMIRGLFGYGGPLDMMRAAERATVLETDPRSPFYSVAQVALGHAAYVLGDLDAALPPLTNAYESEGAPVSIRALALATESLVGHEQGDADRSHERAERAMLLLERSGLRAAPQASLAYTAMGQAQASAGQVKEALTTLGLGLDVGREASTNGPWGLVHHLLVHARVAAEAGQADLARELYGELAWHLDRYEEGMEAMRARAAETRRLAQPEHAPPAPVDPLTGREVDVLRLLQGTMSLHEVAAEMYLSFNTIKTHTRSVYRKLGVHTRTEAVRAGRVQGWI